MTRYTRFLYPQLLAAALSGCAAVSPPGGPLTGSWGANHVALTLDAGGGRVEYDCAAGTIDGPLVLDGAGRFAATGTHTPGQGGPARLDEVPPSYPARYSGSVRGDSMQLRIAVPARGLALGPYELRRGADGNLTRCL